MPVAHKLLERTAKRHGELLKGAEYLTADKGLDDGKLIKNYGMNIRSNRSLT